MKKIQSVLLLAFILTAFLVKSQSPGTSCAGALGITSTTTLSNNQQNFSDGWYNLTSGSFSIYLESTSAGNRKKIKKILAYSGTCSSPILLTSDSLSDSSDSVLYLPVGNPGGPTAFFIKAILQDSSDCPTCSNDTSIYLLAVSGPTVPPNCNYSSTCNITPTGCDLICNGSFENTGLVSGNSQMQQCINWTTATAATPDLFSSSAPFSSGVQVPCNTEFGFQNALNFGGTGNKYAGIFTSAGSGGYGEYLETPLASPLVAGQLYEVSMYVSRGDFADYDNFDVDMFFNFGKFCDVTTTSPLGATYPSAAFPRYTETNTAILNDYYNWNQVKFIFCGSGEDHLIIGSFNGNFGPLGGVTVPGCPRTAIPISGAYLYVDDVSVKSLGSFNVSASPSPQCANAPVNIVVTNGCPGYTFSPTYFNYNFGDGNTLSAAGGNVSHSYALPGTYVITVTLTSSVVTTAFSTCPPFSFTTAVTITSPAISISASPTSVCVGGSSTLTASGASTYTWTGGPNTSTYVVSPTIPTTFTVTGTSVAGCTGTAVVTVNIAPSPPISVVASPASVCAGSSSTLTASGALTYTWTGGPNTSINVVTPTSSTIYTVNGNTSGGCLSTQTVLVNVLPVPNLTITPSIPYLCTSSGGGAIVTLTASGASSYTWSSGFNIFSNVNSFAPLGTTTFTVIGMSANGCTNTAVFTFSIIDNCCDDCFDGNLPLSINTSTTISGKSFCVNADLTIGSGATVTFQNCELKMGPGVRIIVDNGALLNVNNSHLYACTTMWQGIVIRDASTSGPGTGRLSLSNNFLIEDAQVAVDIQGHLITTLSPGLFILNSQRGVFNQNNIGIRIANYTFSTTATTQYLFNVQNTVFTSRTIGYNTSSPYIGSAAQVGNVKATAANAGVPMASPYIDNTTYAPIPTIAGAWPRAGIILLNVGATLNAATTPTYYEIKIGQNGPIMTNIFDNLSFGIDAGATNFTSVNNIYQNTHTVTVASAVTGGVGISALASRGGNHRMRVISGTPVGSFINQFFDCSRAILTANYFEQEVTFCDIRSTQVYPGTIRNPGLPAGKFGVLMSTDRFRKVNISDNKVYNIESAITFNANYGIVSLSPIISSFNGQYSGQIDINRNTIQPHVTLSAVTNQYVENAIYCANVAPPGGSTTSNIPGATVNHNSNQITNVNRGIYSANWAVKNVISNTNCITLLDDPFSPATPQFGINYSNNNPAATSFGNSIFNNAVTGPSATSFALNPLMHGIYESVSTNLNVSCNNVKQTYSGIEFDGAPSLPTLFVRNLMQSHKYGFVLNTAAIIGTQGSPSLPIDDQWLGTGWFPLGTNYKTLVQFGASGLTSNIHVRQTPSQYNPNGSGINGPGSGPGDIYANPATIIYATGPLASCPTGPCLGGGSGSPPGAMISASDIQTMEQIAMDQITYSVNVNETKFIGKNHVYRMLKNDPSLSSSSPILQSFYLANQPTTFGMLSTIEDDLAVGNISTAQANLSAFTPTNNIENNYKICYGFYIKNLTDSIGFDSNDSITVLNLANLCPHTDGPVVYQCRALYNSVYQTVKFFNDNCTPSSSRFIKGFTNSENQKENNFSVVVFPNPSNGEINISPYGILEGELLVSVKDVTGKTVFNNRLYVSNGNSNFTLDAKSGVYFVDVLEPRTGQKIVTKLIIQK